MKTAFFVGCTNLMWVRFIRQISDAGFEFSYICAREEVLNEFEAGTILLHGYMGAIRGILPPHFTPSVPIPLDEALLHDYRDAEIACLEIADRMDTGGAFSYRERLRLYFKTLRFWLELINEFKPDLVFFPDTPHAMFDHVLLHVCRRQNIPMLCFQQIPSLKVILPVHDFAGMNQQVANCLAQREQQHRADDLAKLNTRLPDELNAYLARHDRDYRDAMPDFLKERQQKNRQKSKAIDLPERERVLRHLKNPFRFPRLAYLLGKNSFQAVKEKLAERRRVAPNNYLKRAGEPLEDSYLTVAEWKRYKTNARKLKTELLARYNSLCSTFDRQQPYIYFPLQYQPERTSSPEGGRFNNQILVVQLLSALIPDDWCLVLKENPTQLLSHSAHGERGRWPYFYDDLKAVDKVRFVPMDTSQFELIDSARAIATLTGTTGIESVIRGIPVLAFGSAWYRGCHGVFDIHEQAQCRSALEQIIQGFRPDKRAVILFLLSILDAGVQGVLSTKRFHLEASETERIADELSKLAIHTLEHDFGQS